MNLYPVKINHITDRKSTLTVGLILIRWHR